MGMVPLVSYFELPAGDLHRADVPEPCPMEPMAPLMTTYGEAPPSQDVQAAPSSQPQAQVFQGPPAGQSVCAPAQASQGSSSAKSYASVAPGSFVAAPPMLAPGGAAAQFFAPAPSFPQAVSVVQPHALQSMLGQGSPAAQGNPQMQSCAPVAQGRDVPMKGSYVAPPAPLAAQGAPVAPQYTAAVPISQAASAPSQQPLMFMGQQQVHQQPQWKFSPQKGAATLQVHQAQQPPQIHQAWSNFQLLNQHRGPAQAQPQQQHIQTPEQLQSLWPQHMTAQQALFQPRSLQRPAQTQQILPRRSDHPVVQKSVSVPVSTFQKEGVDALTKTQEIYVYQKSPDASPTHTKGNHESPTAMDACDEVSFAAEGGSVVISHGSNVIVGNTTTETAKVLEQKITAVAAEPTSYTEQDIAQRLVDAVEERNVEALPEVIRQAMLAGVKPDLIEKAKSQSKVLEEESWSVNDHRAASQALQDALRANSTESLKSAFDRARGVGLQGTLFTKAQDELQRRQRRQEAEEELYAALHGVSHGTSSNGLAEALDRATAAGVSSELLSHGRRKLTEVQEYTCSRKAISVAEQKLRELVTTSDVSALSEALESAQESGACLKVIESARKRKVELQEQEWQTQTHHLADQRAEAAFGGFSNDEQGSGSATPASTIGICSDVREELFKLMRMPTRPLEDDLSPIPSAGYVSETPHDSVACMSALQVPLSAAHSAHSVLFPAPESCPVPEPASEPTVFVEPPVVHTPGSTRIHNNQLDESVNTTALRTSLIDEQPAPAPRSLWRPSLLAEDLPPVYGLDAELKAKREANYDTNAEDEAANWVQAITGVQVVGEFGEALRTGQVLCQLLNCIKPGTIAKINKAGMPFKERENISKFLKACRSWGVHEYALFSTDDLYDEKNLLSVVKCIYQLGGVVQRAVPEFQGPRLGVADTSNAKRDQKRAMENASQTGGLHAAMARSHLDVLSTGNVRAPSRGGC